MFIHAIQRYHMKRANFVCFFVVMSCNDMRVATCCDPFGRNTCAYNGNALGRIVFSVCRKNYSCFPHACCSVSQSVSLLSRIFFLPELQKLIKSNKRNMEHLRVVKRQSTRSLLNNYRFQFTKWHMFCKCLRSLYGISWRYADKNIYLSQKKVWDKFKNDKYLH